jgi:hypothetical protein
MARKTQTRTCDQHTARERLRSAESYLTIAADASGRSERADPYRWSSITSNYVLAGIAAADAVCCAALGEHAQGDDHNQARTLIARVSPDGRELAQALGTLLGMKTVAGYGSAPLSEEKAKRAMRAAARLIEAARARAW